MKIYILIEFVHHEDSQIHGVISSLEKAQEWTKNKIDELEKDDYYSNIPMGTLPTGYILEDRGFIYQEFELEEIKT